MLQIDADGLFRAITATGYKLLAYNLDLRTGELVSRTLAPHEVHAAPDAPSVKPLPKIGGDLSAKKDASPFGPPPLSAKPKLFADDTPAPRAFAGDFWKRDAAKKPGIFNDFKRESGSKKLAEIFGEKPPPPVPARHTPAPKRDPFAAATPPASPSASPIPNTSTDPYYPRVPAVSEATQLEWMCQFAKDSGDPQIRDELLAVLKGAHFTQAAHAFERALRSHARTAQQWERYHRKQGLASAEAWLRSLGVDYQLLEKS